MAKKDQPKGHLDLASGEGTFIKGMALGGHGALPACIDVKNGKILRIRPLHLDWKYDPKQFNPWKIKVRGKTLESPLKVMQPPFCLAYKKRVYSPNRIKYPLKRVDWDPDGERNPQNRGKSKYKRISWDEATDIIASEIKRVHKKYGPYAILSPGDGHGESKMCAYCPWLPVSVAQASRRLHLQQSGHPDSWEGWYWGAKHVWGMDEGVGLMTPSNQYCEGYFGKFRIDCSSGAAIRKLLPGFLSGRVPSRLCYYWSELGLKQVYICPDLNYGAAVHADKWIPILPNTDAALQLAIAYIWITEGTYDKEYVKTHTVGFDKFADYVLGKEDGIPKTPAWASQKCGVPEWTIKALARDWASKITSIIHSLRRFLYPGTLFH